MNKYKVVGAIGTALVIAGVYIEAGFAAAMVMAGVVLLFVFAIGMIAQIDPE